MLYKIKLINEAKLINESLDKLTSENKIERLTNNGWIIKVEKDWFNVKQDIAFKKLNYIDLLKLELSWLIK